MTFSDRLKTWFFSLLHADLFSWLNFHMFKMFHVIFFILAFFFILFSRFLFSVLLFFLFILLLDLFHSSYFFCYMSDYWIFILFFFFCLNLFSLPVKLKASNVHVSLQQTIGMLLLPIYVIVRKDVLVSLRVHTRTSDVSWWPSVRPATWQQQKIRAAIFACKNRWCIDMLTRFASGVTRVTKYSI